MKKIFLLVAFCVSISLAANAQGPSKRQHRGESPMYEKLDLTQQQKDQMKKMREEFSAQRDKLKEDKNLTKEQKSTQVKELREKHREQVKQILTPEQQTKMAEMREKRGDGMKNDRKFAQRGKQHRKAPKGERGGMMKDLNLTDQQKEKMKSLNHEYKNKSKELADKRRDDMMAILTPEQQTKMKEKRTEMVAKRAGVNKEGAGKLQALRETFEKEKGAVERSRIAPDMQKKKIDELADKYKAERKQIIKDHSTDTKKQNRGKRS